MRQFCITLMMSILFFATIGRAESQSLAGDWKVALDPSDEGIKQSWFQSHDFAGTLKLPGTTDLAKIGTRTQGSYPGSLTRVFEFYGPAWYEREINVPQDWQGKSVDLFLERVLWESRVWIDGKACDTQDALSTPHIHSLGQLSPGKHKLTVRISNMMIHPWGEDAHNFTEQTQTIWNGAIGRIELQAHDAVSVSQFRVFPDAAAKRVKIEANFRNSGSARDGFLTVMITEPSSDKPFASIRVPVKVDAGTSVIEQRIELPAAPKLWDEFTPNLYHATAIFESEGRSVTSATTFGFRELKTTQHQILINGRPMFVRGNMDHCVFPLTGHPPMEVEGWKRVFAIYKQHGMNQMRCHAWTPPEAAFIAADEMGIYIQTEIFWMQYPLGSGKPVGDMKQRSATPKSFASSDQSPDEFVKAEMRRVIDTYGNHPSLVFFVIGNELGRSDWKATAEWINAEKQHDPRHLYAVSTAREITPADDFADTHAVPKVGWVRDRVEPMTDWDYEKLYAKAPVPVIAHELGQWPTYPRWSEISQFTGVVQARDLEECRALAQRYGVEDQNEAFHNASGALAIRLYKDQMESHYRTPSCSGFSTLCMQDYPGQGEALVGWLDSFFDSKGIVTPERFRRWCNSSVPLVRVSKYVYTADEAISATAELAHFGASDWAEVKPHWRLLDASGAVLREGDLPAIAAKTGGLTSLGAFTVPLSDLKSPARVRLELQCTAGDTTLANDWDFWIFPSKISDSEPSEVAVVTTLDDAKKSLSDGKKTLLLAHQLGSKRNKQLANFKPVYWSEWYFPWSETLGALVQNQHPAMAQFPTDDHYDWQWQDLCKTGRGFVVDRLPRELKPIVQPIPDFHLNHRYATIFEASVGQGKLLVCGYDVATKLDTRLAARQLRLSLLSYMHSDAFSPAIALTDSQLDQTFPRVTDLPDARPPAFKEASLYVVARSPTEAPWKKGVDQKQGDEGFDYAITGAGARSTQPPTWAGAEMKINVQVPKANLYDLYLHFIDPDRKGRQGTIEVEGRKFALPTHTGDGKWLKIEILREDCLDKELQITTHADSGPDLQIDQLGLIPRNP